MTILPKKKHQESRKNDQDHDADNRNRSRIRSTRETVRNRLQQHPQSDEFQFDDLGTCLDSSESPLSPTIFNDLETRDNHEGFPHKRSRHPQCTSYLLSSNTPGPNHPSARLLESPVDEEVNEGGYNSSDEHISNCNVDISKGVSLAKNISEKESEFERELRERKGFTIKQMATDGACMFRAVADQVYGDQEMHSVVRKHCMDYMVQNRDFFSQYITEDFVSYIRRKRIEHSHGNHIEMQALSEMYNRPIEVYQYSYEPINTFLSRSHTIDNPPIRLSYHGNIHYNSVIDPYSPTVGVGLGLAGYRPEVEDQRSLAKAEEESGAMLLEQEMLEDKIKATDWEATDEQLAELAARESYLQWLKDNKKTFNSGASCSSSTSSTQRKKSPSHDGSTGRLSPPRDCALAHRSPSREAKRSSPPHESHARGSTPLTQHPKGENVQYEDLLGATAILDGAKHTPNQQLNNWNYALGHGTEWDNDPVLAAILAQSQQEYLDSLTRTSSNSNKPGETK